MLEFGLAVWGGVGVEDGIPGTHYCGAGDEALLQGLWVDVAAGVGVGLEDGVG